MKVIFILIFALVSIFTLHSQEQILKHCVVLQYDPDASSDLQKASFELPFFARREGSKSEIKERYIGFDLLKVLPISAAADKTNETFKIEMEHVVPYKYGQDYAAGELGFLVMEMDEKVLAFFPSINDSAIDTEYLIFKEDMALPEKLVNALDGKYLHIKKGAYKISEIEF